MIPLSSLNSGSKILECRSVYSINFKPPYSNDSHGDLEVLSGSCPTQFSLFQPSRKSPSSWVEGRILIGPPETAQMTLLLLVSVVSLTTVRSFTVVMGLLYVSMTLTGVSLVRLPEVSVVTSWVGRILLSPRPNCLSLHCFSLTDGKSDKYQCVSCTSSYNVTRRQCSTPDTYKWRGSCSNRSS